MAAGENKLYSGAVLAPMVRCGTTPLRVLALRFGADTVWSEEIIDRKLSICTRVINEELNTIDYIGPGGVEVFRICPSLEQNKLICQLGSAGPESALAAAKLIENDVSGIDINMGCPLKFSVKGGMGSALLKKPDVAESIIKILSENCQIPISAKIRIIENMDKTIEFAKRLTNAGASCITLHMRSAQEKDRDPAHWDMIAPLVQALHPIPVIANGDLYRWPDIEQLRLKSGISGAMLGRPALMNLSMFRREMDLSLNEFRGLPLLPIEQVVILYIEECIRWNLIHQYCKYTILEMLNTRRHQKRFYDMKIHLEGREMLDVSRASSLREVATLFGITENRYDEIVNMRTSISPQSWNELQSAKINEFSKQIISGKGLVVNIPAPQPSSSLQTASSSPRKVNKKKEKVDIIQEGQGSGLESNKQIEEQQLGAEQQPASKKPKTSD